ncbi:unnamed protein product [Penicillium salamii]|uniref:Uncharacterized protein n=1 Tax=Penicillium salamii TaxID=1612424 RepID=A0A9W4MZT8_9EURO|nr:unnamed protein product [Penicillium salamii]
MTVSLRIDLEELPLNDIFYPDSETDELSGNLLSLTDFLDTYANCPYERWYRNRLAVAWGKIDSATRGYLVLSEKYVQETYSTLVSSLRPSASTNDTPAPRTFKAIILTMALSIHYAPRLLPILLLE